MFYLFERSYYSDNGYTFVGSPYINYSKIPYCRKLEDILDESSENHLFHESSLAEENCGRYRICNCPSHRADTTLSSGVLDTTIEVVENHGNKDKEMIIEEIKSLPEVKNVQKYGLIRFEDAKIEN